VVGAVDAVDGAANECSSLSAAAAAVPDERMGWSCVWLNGGGDRGREGLLRKERNPLSEPPRCWGTVGLRASRLGLLAEAQAVCAVGSLGASLGGARFLGVRVIRSCGCGPISELRPNSTGAPLPGMGRPGGQMGSGWRRHLRQYQGADGQFRLPLLESWLHGGDRFRCSAVADLAACAYWLCSGCCSEGMATCFQFLPPKPLTLLTRWLWQIATVSAAPADPPRPEQAHAWMWG